MQAVQTFTLEQLKQLAIEQFTIQLSPKELTNKESMHSVQ